MVKLLNAHVHATNEAFQDFPYPWYNISFSFFSPFRYFSIDLLPNFSLDFASVAFRDETDVQLYKFYVRFSSYAIRTLACTKLLCNTGTIVPFILPHCHNHPRLAPVWPRSSVGRAMVMKYGGHGFDSHQGQRCFLCLV